MQSKELYVSRKICCIALNLQENKLPSNYSGKVPETLLYSHNNCTLITKKKQKTIVSFWVEVGRGLTRCACPYVYMYTVVTKLV